MGNVLQREHPRLGSKVTVTRHNDLTTDLTTDQSSQSGPSPSHVDMVQSLRLELTPSDIDSLLIKCLMKDITCLSEELQQLKMKMEVESTHVSVISTGFVTSEWPETAKKQVIELIQKHYAIASYQKLPEVSFPEITEILLQLKEDHLFDFKFHGRNLHAWGTADVITQCKSKIKITLAKHTHDQIAHKLSPVEYEFTTQVILEQLKAEFPAVTITPDSKSYSLHLAGSVANMEAFVDYLKKYSLHKDVEVNVSQLLINYLNSSDGHSKLHNYIRNKAGVYFYSDDSKGLVKLKLLCRDSDLKVTQTIASNLQEVLTEQHVTLSESFLLVKSHLTDYESTCTHLESTKHVKIIPGKKSVIVAGFKGDDLDNCLTTLRGYIEKESKLRKDVDLSATTWRLLNCHMKNKWDHLVSQSKKKNVSLDTGSSPHVSLYGDRVNVESVLDALTKLQQSIKKLTFPIKRPGSCEFFTSEKARTYLDGIEYKAKVTIDVFIAGSEKLPSLYSDLPHNNVTTECSVSINRIKVSISVGDITEFKADVIVNAANEDLKHVGGVARAIAQKGGQVIQDDSTQQVKRCGKVDTGNVWLTTKTGNLPCKALIHAVGPRWSGGNKKEVEVALLYKACRNSLEQSTAYRSIVFPAISSGVYGFPIDLCADTMIRAALDFSSDNPDSQLKNVTFIVHPTQAHHSEVFISKLKTRLPADKVALLREPQVTLKSSLSASSPGKTKQGSLAVPGNVFSKVELRKGGLLDVKVCYRRRHCTLVLVIILCRLMSLSIPPVPI